MLGVDHSMPAVPLRFALLGTPQTSRLLHFSIFLVQLIQASAPIILDLKGFPVALKF